MKKVLTMLTIVLLLAGGKAYAISQIEREALIALYESTDGDNWSRNDGWKTPPLAADGFAMPETECNWYGIDCRYMGLGLMNEISGLSLVNNQLSGTIPPELGNFGILAYFALSNNQLTGSIPPELGNLSISNWWDDAIFNLSNNQLTGPIPPELGNLTINGDDYAIFNLSNNQLTGPIPPELGNLSISAYWTGAIFDLSDNQLTGPIPPELGNLSISAGSWAWFNLSNNQLSGAIPPELGNLGGLSFFDLNNNQLTGSIPPELGNLRNVIDFDLSNNQLSGAIPPELGKMHFVLWLDPTFLDLSNNQLSGPIPSELGNCDLTDINLSNNQLTGPIPLELFTGYDYEYGWLMMGWERSFDLSHNLLIGPIQLEFDNEWTMDLGEINICNNYLYTDDNQTLDFLNDLQPGWEACQYALPEFNFTPASLSVPASAGSASVNVSNTAGGALHWAATVTSGGDWLSLTSGSSGIDTGTVSCTFSQNSAGQRIGTIRFESLTEQSQDYQVTQAAATHTLTTSASPSAGGSVTRSPNESTFTHNDTVQLTATPNPGYTFINWSGDASGSSNPVTVTMDSNKNVTAHFAADIATPTFTPDGGIHTGETVSVTVTCATPEVTIHYTTNGDEPTESSPRVASGAAVSVPIPGTLKARAWLSSDASATKTSAYTGPDTHTLNLFIFGQGHGSLTSQPAGITCHGTQGDSCVAYFNADSEVTLTANSELGSAFKDWGGDCAGQPGNTCTLVMDADKIIEVHFLLTGQPNAIGDYLSIVTLPPAERDFLLDIGDGTKPFPGTSPIKEVRFQNNTAIIYYRDGTSQVVNVRHGDGYADDFINAVLLSDTPDHTFTTLLDLPSFDVELEFPNNFVIMCYPGITPVGSGPGIQISDLVLLKLKPVGQPSIPFAYRVSAPVDGDFWITNHLQATVLPPTHTLTPGQVVDLYLTVDDNGLYDLNDSSNVIVDPLVLGQLEEQIILAPSELSYPTTSSTGSFTVTWSAAAGAESYRLEYSTDGGNTWELRYMGSDKSYAENVGNGSYRYRVMASDASNDSDWQTGGHDCVVTIQAQPESGDDGGGGCFIGAMASVPRFP